MKKIYKRLIAYIIDIAIISVIISCLTNNSFTNPSLKQYNKTYDECQELSDNYTNFTTDLKKYYEDKSLTEDEYNKLNNKYEYYNNTLEKYYQDNNLTSTNYQKLLDETNQDFQNKYKKLYKTLNKYSITYNIIYIIIILLYFVGLNIITEGQTLGKKILKLKIVNNNDNSNISILNYFIRAIILYNPIYYLALIIGVYIFNSNNFYIWAIVWANIKDYLEVIILLMIIIKKDNRGLHDILSKTKVVALDKEENIIEEFNEINNNEQEKVKKIRR